MFRSLLFKLISVTSFLTFMFCNISQPEENLYGSITGKVLYPDSNLIIRIIPEDGQIDTVTRDPVSKMFTFDQIKYGTCVLEVKAVGYELYKKNILLDSSVYICHDITLVLAYGSISGKVLSPDSDLTIRIIPEDGRVDTVTRDPVSKTFTFDSVKTGLCILQILSTEYGFHEQKFILNSQHLICHDIVLAKTPTSASYLFPSNSQNFDSTFFSIEHSSITDTGIQVVITFNDWMDSVTLKQVLDIRPDTVGVKAELVQRQSLVVFFPYWKLATVDTVSITVGRGLLDRWGDSLNCDYSVFFPVDKNYIRAARQ